MHKTNNNSRKENTKSNEFKSKKHKKQTPNHSKFIQQKTKDASLKRNSKHSNPKEINLFDLNEELKLIPSHSKQLKPRIISASPHKVRKNKSKSKNNTNKHESYQSLRTKKRVNGLKKDQLLVSNEEIKQKQLCIQSTHFFPFSHQPVKFQDVNFVSQYLSSNQSYLQSDNKSRLSVPISYQERQQSINLKKSRLVPIEQWQNYETLKLKNEQLSNYIEQLQKIERKLIAQRNEQQNHLVNQQRAKRLEIQAELQELNAKHTKVCSLNSSLQQMFNQSQQTIQALRQEKDILTQRIKQSDQRQKILLKHNQKIQGESVSLKVELITLKNNLQTLQNKTNYFESKYKQSCNEKQKIKMLAQELLIMVKKLKQNEQIDTDF